MMKRSVNWLRWIGIGFVYGFGLNRFPVPLTGDQKVYLSTALEMRERGEVMVPYLFGSPSFYKPPLQYWATLLGWKVFGLSVLGTFAIPFLALLLTCYFLREISSLLQSKPSSDVTVDLWFAASAGALTYTLSAQMEIYLVFFTVGAWWWVFRFPKYGLFGAFVFAGLLSLVKSPLYSVFWVSSYVLYLSLTGSLQMLKTSKFWIALALGVAIGLSWYLYIFGIEGPKFFQEYVLRETLAKASVTPAPLGKMWLNLVAFALPFAPILFWAIFWGITQESLNSRTQKLFLSASVIPALFFSIFPYRTETYLFVVFPFLVLWFSEFSEGLSQNRWSAFVRPYSGLLTIAVSLLIVILWRGGFIAEGGAGALLFSLVFLMWSAARKLNALRVSAVMLCVIFGFRVGITDIGEADVRGLKEVHQSLPHRVWVMWDEEKNIWFEVGLLSIVLGEPIQRLYTEEAILKGLHEGAIFIGSEEQALKLQKLAPGLQEELTLKPWLRWQKRIRFPLKEILKGEHPPELHRRFAFLYTEEM